MEKVIDMIVFSWLEVSFSKYLNDGDLSKFGKCLEALAIS